MPFARVQHNSGMYARDGIPHIDTTWDYSEAYVEKLGAGLDEQTAYKILRGYAIKMLELDQVSFLRLARRPPASPPDPVTTVHVVDGRDVTTRPIGLRTSAPPVRISGLVQCRPYTL